MNNTLYMPAWLYVISSIYLNLTKSFFPFPVAHIVHVSYHIMVGLMITMYTGYLAATWAN